MYNLDCKLSSSTFGGNIAALGGGLNVLGADFTGDNLIFQNNSASNFENLAPRIGAELTQSTISITNSVIQSNTAPNGVGSSILKVKTPYRQQLAQQFVKRRRFVCGR